MSFFQNISRNVTRTIRTRSDIYIQIYAAAFSCPLFGSGDAF